MRSKSEIDVAVLLIFFSRPSCFGKVFEQVKKARPSKLFLYQDGPRKGNDNDIKGIAECRKIAEDIDWECEIHTLYQEENVGCDPSEYIAQKWAFSYVEKCIVLEDDDVPSQSFFVYCKELLDKYENDERIGMICGMNNLETWDCPDSYFFTKGGSIWGWASWRRVIDTWEGDYAIGKDEYYYSKLLKSMKNSKMDSSSFDTTYKWHTKSGKEYYESILGTAIYANNQLNIVPTQNMILNIGNTVEGGTHSVDGIELIPHKLRKIFTMKVYDIEFPLKHPKYLIEDIEYVKEVNRLMGTGNLITKYARMLESAFLIAKYKGVRTLVKKIRNHISKRGMM